jgi:hypothetical protein
MDCCNRGWKKESLPPSAVFLVPLQYDEGIVRVAAAMYEMDMQARISKRGIDILEAIVRLTMNTTIGLGDMERPQVIALSDMIDDLTMRYGKDSMIIFFKNEVIGIIMHERIKDKSKDLFYTPKRL